MLNFYTRSHHLSVLENSTLTCITSHQTRPSFQTCCNLEKELPPINQHSTITCPTQSFETIHFLQCCIHVCHMISVRIIRLLRHIGISFTAWIDSTLCHHFVANQHRHLFCKRTMCAWIPSITLQPPPNRTNRLKNHWVVHPWAETPYWAVSVAPNSFYAGTNCFVKWLTSAISTS